MRLNATLYLPAIICVGLALRLYQLDTLALWIDESYSYWFASQSWAYLWQDVPVFETHPPFYYSILKLAMTLGESEFMLRLPSAIASTCVIPLVYLSTRWSLKNITFAPQAALLAAWCIACMPVQLQFAQDARPYALLNVSVALSIAAAVRIIQYHDHTRSLLRLTTISRDIILSYLGLVVGLSLTLWLHNLGCFFVLTIALVLGAACVIPRFKPKLLANLLICAAIVALLYSPWLPNFFGQLSATNDGQFWLERPGWRRLLCELPQLYGPAIGSKTAAGLTAYALTTGIIASTSIAIILVNVLRKRTTSNYAGITCCGAVAFVPVLLSLVITYVMQPVYILRIVSPAQAGWCVVLAAAVFAASRPGNLRHAIIITIALIAGASAVMYHLNLTDTVRPWRSITQQILQSDAATAPVITIPNAAALPLYYYDEADALNLWPLPAAYPDNKSYHTYPAGGRGVPDIRPADINQLVTRLRDTDDAWLIRRSNFYDKDHAVEAALQRSFDFTPIMETHSIYIYRLTRHSTSKTANANN